MTSFAALHDPPGKVAIVTGGSRGIGRAIVQTLAEAAGYRCRICQDQAKQETCRPDREKSGVAGVMANMLG